MSSLVAKDSFHLDFLSAATKLAARTPNRHHYLVADGAMLRESKFNPSMYYTCGGAKGVVLVLYERKTFRMRINVKKAAQPHTQKSYPIYVGGNSHTRISCWICTSAHLRTQIHIYILKLLFWEIYRENFCSICLHMTNTFGQHCPFSNETNTMCGSLSLSSFIFFMCVCTSLIGILPINDYIIDQVLCGD